MDGLRVSRAAEVPSSSLVISPPTAKGHIRSLTPHVRNSTGQQPVDMLVTPLDVSGRREASSNILSPQKELLQQQQQQQQQQRQQNQQSPPPSSVFSHVLALRDTSPSPPLSYGRLSEGTSSDERLSPKQQFLLPPATFRRLSGHVPSVPYSQQEQQQEQQQLSTAMTDYNINTEEVVMLREQVSLLMKRLEEEQKRRASEQQLMQQKILELQSLIRTKMPEQQNALERRARMRSPRPRSRSKTRVSSKHSSSSNTLKPKGSLTKSMKVLEISHGEVVAKDENMINQQEETHASRNPAHLSLEKRENAENKIIERTKQAEAKAKQQLTKLRARMHALVIQAQVESQTLRSQMDLQKKTYEKREQQIRVEYNSQLSAIVEKNSQTKKKLTTKAESLSTEVNQLTEENSKLLKQVAEQNARIEHLELALGGKAIVHP